MEQWETIQTIGSEFDTFLENLPKEDRKFLCACGSSDYDRFIAKKYNKR